MTMMRSLVRSREARGLSACPLRLAQAAGTAISLAALLTAASIAQADPTGGQVVAGQASIHQNGPNTVIHAGNNAILNFHSFNIAAHETVRFIQPSSTSRVLNRITGPDPSVIAGRLTANGIVYIANPAGVYFARGSVVNVGGIYAAAGTISNADFLSGANKFSGLSGSVENHGTITGSAVNLIGQRVANYGSIVAPQGMVALAAGDEVYIGQENGQIFARVNSAPGSGPAQGTGVEQAGAINASGGQVSLGAGDMYALAIHHTGSTTARDITLKGGDRGVVKVAGTLNASNQAPGQTGGRIQVLGDRVGIDGATLDASGSRGGGTILVGGDFQGQGETPTASRAVVSRGSMLNAEATHQGDGGKVIVWSDDTTIYRGDLSVRGGAQGGNGGFAEVSGKENLLFAGGAQTHSRAGGQDGTLLLDPRDITIQAGTGPDDPELGDSEILFGDGSPAATTDFIIGTDTLEALTGNILLQAQRDITLLAGADLNLTNQGSGESVKFQAGNDINILASITTSGGSLILIANDDGAGTSTGTGIVNIQAPIDTNGGAITLSGAGITLAADLSADAGTMTFSAPVVLEEDTLLTAAGVIFESTVDSAAGEFNDLTVNASGTSFLGSVGVAGQDTALGTLTTNPAGSTLISAAEVRAQVLHFRDGVVIEEDTTFTAETSITFERFLNSTENDHKSVTLNSPLTTFNGGVGSSEAARLGTLSTDAAGTTIFGGGEFRAQRFTIRDLVEISDDTTISATQAMTFVRSIDSSGGANDLTLQAPAIALFGAIGQIQPLGTLSTSANSRTFFRGGAITADTVDFNGGLILNPGANTINATTAASFGSIDGEDVGGGTNPNLLVNSPLTTFGGPIGTRSNGQLGVLTTDAAGRTVLDTSNIIAREVRFNDRVELDSSVNLTGTQLVRFGNTVNSVQDEQNVLNIISPQTLFVGSIGNVHRLAQLNTDEAGTTVLGGPLLRVHRATFEDRVTLTNDLTIDSTSLVRFQGALNSQAGQQRTLTLAAGEVALVGGVGAAVQGELGALLMSGTTTLGGTVTTIGDQTYQGPVRIETDATLNAPNIFFEDTVNSAGQVDRALTLNTSGGGITRFDGVVGVLNPLSRLTTNADGTTVLAAGSITTSGDQLYEDPVVLASNVTIFGNNIRFDRTIDSDDTPRALTVNSTGGGFTTFGGAVGAANALASIATNGDGGTRIQGGSVTTIGHQSFNDNVVINVDTTLTGTSITLGGTVNSNDDPRALTIRPAENGTTNFGGAVGNIVALATLLVAPSVTGPSPGVIQIFGGSVRTIGEQRYNQRIVLGADTTLTATTININQGVNSQLLDTVGLTINSAASGITNLLGSIGGASPLKHLITNSDGVTNLGRSVGATENNSVVTTTQAISFGDAVVVRDSVTITGGGGVNFGGTLNGESGDAVGPDVVLRTNITAPGSAGSLAIPRITFTGNIGNSTPLGSLTLGNDLGLTPAVATIGAGLGSNNTPIPNYALTIDTRRGFAMGQRQKMTILGDLTINAPTEARLSDINTLGTLTVNSPTILLQRRPSGRNVLAGPGGLREVRDPGLDFVARQITFSSTPQAIGSGAQPRFGTPTGDNTSDNLRGFSQREVGDLRVEQFRSGANYLDLIAGGPGAVNIAESLAAAVPPVFLGADVADTTASDPATRQELEEIGIPTRPDTTTTTAGAPLTVPTVSSDRQALLAFLSAPGLYVDVGGPRPETGPLAVTISRLPAALVSRVLASYRAVFTREEIDPETGERRYISNTEQVSQVLSAAWAEYFQRVGAQANGVGFRAYLEAVPTQAEALHYLNGLRRLFSDIGLLGLAPAEARRARDAILEALNVEGISKQQLETAIVTQQLGEPQ